MPTKNEEGAKKAAAAAGAAKGGRNNNQKPFGYGAKLIAQKSKFEGRCKELEGHVYDICGAQQANQFIKTTEEIGLYVGQHYSHGGDIATAVRTYERPTFESPEDPPDDATIAVRKRWEDKLKRIGNREEVLEDNITKLYNLIWGQCSDAMQAKVESLPEFAAIRGPMEGIGLLKLLKTIAFKFEPQVYKPLAIDDAIYKFIHARQSKQMSAAEYLEQFQNNVDVLDAVGATFGPHRGVVEMITGDQRANEATPEQYNEATERSIAIAFINRADRTRYGRLLEDLRNNYLMGQDNYPRSLNQAYNLLVNWQQDPRNMIHYGAGPNDGVVFAHQGDEEEEEEDDEAGTTLVQETPRPARGGKSHITCFRCKKKGHYKSECPLNDLDKKDEDAEEIGTSLLANGKDHGETVLTQRKSSEIPKCWVLLDNQSTVDVFSNAALLRNIRKVDRSMYIQCTAGTTSTNMMGDLEGYGPVWYHPGGIANILSLSRVRQNFRVTFDSEKGNVFKLIRPDGTARSFRESSNGLYFSVMEPVETTMVTTVEQNKAKYTKADYLQAVLARKIQAVIGRPSTKEFTRIVKQGLLPNCPITPEDIEAAEHIFGTDVGALKGKTTRQAPEKARMTGVAVPTEIIDRYKSVTLCGDIMFVNKIPFFVSISRNLKFGTAEMIANRQRKTVFKAVEHVCNLYRNRGFSVKFMLMDNEFECIRGDLANLGVTLNTTAQDEHVGEIERYIRTIKERTRCVYNSVPFRKMPMRMITEMVYASVFWLNCFPSASGVSTNVSPRTIVTGQSIDYAKHCRLEFGSYVQTHEQHDNSMAPRTTGAVALRPTGNAQGGYYFMSLTTGRRISRNQWTALPMPQDVINRIVELGEQQYADAGIEFLDRDRRDIGDLGDNLSLGEQMDDQTVIEIADDNEEYNDNHDYINNDNEEHNDNHDYVNNDYNNNDGYEYVYREVNDGANGEQEAIRVPIAEIEHGAAIIFPDDVLREPEEIVEEPMVQDGPGNIEAEAGEPPEDNQGNDINLDQEMNERYGERTGAYNLRPRRARDYGHLHTMIEDVTLTQLSMKQGLKTFGDKGREAVLSEIKQLHDRGVIQPKDPNSLSTQDKKNALEYLMFLKRKRCGKIKGRGCADGRKQRVYIAKEEASSPTVSIEALMISCVIDAKEKRDVATADIPGAFLQADMDELVYMKLDGVMVDILMELDPKKYGPHVVTHHGKKTVYVQLVKALYGTLRAALLFWRKLSQTLVGWGFVINQYDQCVANKIINGKQCTVLWHVDDLKISHEDPSVVTLVLDKLSSEFGEDAPMTITRGTVHDYLGMRIEYSNDGKVKITMDDYVEAMLSDLPRDMDGTATSPASNHLFMVNTTNPTLLSSEESELFHHNVAKLLFLCKRARPDLQTAVAFLTTRVKKPDTDDQKKLVRVMRYLRGTKGMPLTLQANGVHVVNWWIDAAFAVHVDMKGHTGGAMSLGKGVIYGTSKKQKIVSRSSTEAELIGVYDVMPQVLWTRHFLIAQGYKPIDSVVHQDNKSAILLEENGKASSSKRTRHLNIRYFFVTDHVKARKVLIKYSPTEDMVSDYFTKPLQGSLFRKMRNIIMNVDPDAATCWDHRSVLEEISDMSDKTASENGPANSSH
jgi:hypothetical protein